MFIKIKSESGILPQYETEGSSGMDLKACLKGSTLIIEKGERVLVPTGLYIELPKGYEAQIRGRSGLAIKHGIGLVNGIGTIDSDYRGEIKVILINWSNNAFKIIDGDRIAQMVIAKYERAEFEKINFSQDLSQTDRGVGGFGHTGKK